MAISIALLLSALDGYDLLAMSFAAPAVAAAWGIGRAALGMVLAAGLAGLAIGSLLLSPPADIVGRKALVLLAFMLMAMGMLGAAFSSSLSALIFWRIFTGLGGSAELSAAAALWLAGHIFSGVSFAMIPVVAILLPSHSPIF